MVAAERAATRQGLSSQVSIRQNANSEERSIRPRMGLDRASTRKKGLRTWYGEKLAIATEKYEKLLQHKTRAG
jgi:hypothetical protein